MPIGFPSNPALGQTFSYGDRSWQWDGSGWRAMRLSAVVAPVIGQNILINGDFSINQRKYAGAALAAGAYGYDRWGAYNGGATYSVSTAGVVTITAGTLCQVLESPGLAGQQVTVSLEDPTATITAQIGNGLGTVAVGGTIAAGSGRRSFTFTVPSNFTGNLKFFLSGAGATFKKVKLELGAVATQFADGIQLDRCLRYYNRFDAPLIPIAGFTDGAAFYLPFTVQMRAAPAGMTNITNDNFSVEPNVSAGKWGLQMAGVAVVTKTGAVTVSIGFPTVVGACVFLFGTTFSRTSDLFVGATGIFVTFDAELVCTD